MTELLVVLAAATGAMGIVVMLGAGGTARETARPTRAARRDPQALLVAFGVAGASYALTGWVLPSAVLACGAGWLFSGRRQRSGGDGRSVERVEALASWVENVRDVLRAGNQPIGAIGATVESCPVLVRPAVRGLYSRLSAGVAPDVAVRRFADELDDPLADLVAIGLLVAITRGAETEGVLSSLAAQTRHHADRRRLVDAERAPVQREVQMVTVVMCLLLAGLFVFGRSSYLDAYDDAAGQVVLATVLAGYAALIGWAIRLTRFPRPARFLTLATGPDR